MEIPGYTIEKQIGKGGMARVYLATHLGLDRKVAIKVMNKQLDEDDSGFSDRFMREARIVANLTHQNIVTVYDVGSHDGYNYIAMEYLPGGITLDHKIKDGLSLQEGLTTIKQIAAALGYAHGKHIVHRDIKPENIMYREDGSAVLTDFGIARASNSVTKMTATGTVIGTPHYMSPEQAQGHEIGAFSDIYSLGIVFYEILTGAVPYDADSTIAVVFKHITEPVPVLHGDVALYQPVLDHMMAKNKDERYAHCEEIITDINAIAGTDKATLINNATVINKARPTSAANGTTIGPAETVINTAGAPKKAAKSSNKLVAALAFGAIASVSLIAGGYYYSEQGAEDNQLAEQARQEKIKQAQLKEQEAQKAAEKQRELAEQKVKQKEESERLAALQKQKDKEAELAAQRKAEQEAKLAAQQAEAKKVAEQARLEKQNKVNALLATAEQQLLNSQLDKAYTTFKSALKLDSGNKQARGGVTRVASQYLSLANIAAAGYDFDTANKHINTVIKIAPTHSKLAETQGKVFEYKNEQLVKQAEAARKAELEKQASTQPVSAPEPEKKRRSFGGF